MNDEIKEIKLDHFKDLEELKQNVENWIATDEMYWERWFGLYDIKTLLDCITNLQEELKSANESITWWQNRFNAVEEENKELKTENEKLKEIEQEHKNCTRKHWQEKCAEHLINEKNYKSRNEKANALLDEMLERAYIDGEYIMYDYSTSELLEVKQALQGEDKDV